MSGFFQTISESLKQGGLCIGLAILILTGHPGWCDSVATNDVPYILDAGDEISIEDATLGALAGGPLRLADDGLVDLPMVGATNLTGLTVEQAQDLLNRQYKHYLLNPAINMQVLSQHPLRVYAQGAVNHPGVLISGKNTRPDSNDHATLGSMEAGGAISRFYLSDALIQAGGLRQDADYRDIQIHRSFPTEQVLHVNLWELFQHGASGQDIPLQDRDVITVTEMPRTELLSNDDWKTMSRSNISVGRFQVNVIGAVKQPGSYPVGVKDTVLSAIAQAGGFAAQASQKNIYLLRANSAGQIFKKRINASDARLLGKGKSTWISLLPGDLIFVDDSPAKEALSAGRALVDRATGAALLPIFSSLLRNGR